MASLYDFSVDRLDGSADKLERWRGDVLLIVNTASKCGFTPQYAGLEALHRDLAPRGFSVLGFPCNQFGNQEPGDFRGDRRLLPDELRRHLSDVRQDRRQR